MITETQVKTVKTKTYQQSDTLLTKHKGRKPRPESPARKDFVRFSARQESFKFIPAANLNTLLSKFSCIRKGKMAEFTSRKEPESGKNSSFNLLQEMEFEKVKTD